MNKISLQRRSDILQFYDLSSLVTEDGKYLLDVSCDGSFGVKVQRLDPLDVLFLLLALERTREVTGC